MNGSTRITFRFGRDTEVQYLSRVPDVGDRVTRGRELWLVTSVENDATGAVVICERPDGSGGGNNGGVEAFAWRG